jgi:hypothetical protein
MADLQSAALATWLRRQLFVSRELGEWISLRESGVSFQLAKSEFASWKRTPQ